MLALAACGGPIDPTSPTPTDCVGDACDETGDCFVLDTEALDFGELPLADGPSDATLTITNTCGFAVFIDGIALTSPAAGRRFEILDAPTSRPVVGGSDEYVVQIRALPAEYGAFADELEVRAETRRWLVPLTAHAVCESVAADADGDADGVPDGCDVCLAGDDALDADGDAVPDACDVCPDADDNRDADGDTVPDGCDVCVIGDDRIDSDNDTVPDGCDVCSRGDDTVDGDSDGVPDACDRCLGADDLADADVDQVPDGCDLCQGFDDRIDRDADAVPDGCDLCQGFDDRIDSDADTTPDGCDLCMGSDDRIDIDGDSVPDGCDVCPGADDAVDTDGDAVADGCDVCPGFDDAADSDGDGVADGCDVCAGFDDLADIDGDTIPDRCDPCPTLDDAIDDDGDGVPGGLDATGQVLAGSCDRCEGFDDAVDADSDSVPDGCDACAGFDDRLDDDFDTVPDDCDVCTGFDDLVDTDADTVPDGCDGCAGFDDAVDDDADGVPGGVDATGQILAGSCDRCEGFDDAVDDDHDGRPDREPDCDPCVGLNTFEAFPPTPGSQTDFLFVIDDSASMAPYQAALANNAFAFVNALGGLNVDWQIAVISTTSPAFQGPVIVNAPNAVQEFSTQVSVGTGGNPLEEGIERAYEATQPGFDAGPNSPTGFLRANANLVIVFVSDEPDASNSVTPQLAYDYWVNLKGDPSRFMAHAIVPPPPNGGYDTVVSLSGGWMTDIAAVQWGADLASIAISSFGAQTFPLANVPVPQSLLVRADGIPLHGWLYDQATNSVVFETGGAPPAGSLMTAEYIEDCEGVIDGCSDGIDNDGDGLVDFPDEPGCTSPHDPNEIDPVLAPTCANGVDDDGDLLADHPLDPQCESAAYAWESCALVDSDLYYQLCEDTGAAATCPDLSRGTPLPLADEGAVSVPLGFDFDFYGEAYSTVYVGANGTLNFDLPLSPPVNQCLPGFATDRSILVWWDDLNPAGGHVWTRTAGAAPNRQFQVQWRAPHVQGGTPIDVRAVLQENSGEIDLCYVDTDMGGISDGRSATSGLQHDAAHSLQYSCFSADLTADRVLRFAHPGVPR